MNAVRPWAELIESLDAKVKRLTKSRDDWHALVDLIHENEDALLPDCPVCGGTGSVLREARDEDQGHGEVLVSTRSLPCPDCTDGKVSVAQMAALWQAVWDDSWYVWRLGDYDCPRDNLRAVRP